MAKNILITGTTGNLGSAVADKFIQSGYCVIGSKSPDRKEPNDGVHYFEADLTKKESTKLFYERIIEEYGDIDSGIFLVGGFGMSNLANATDQDIYQMFDLNFMTAFHSCQNIYPLLKGNGGGKIVLVGAKPAIEGGGAETLGYTLAKTSVLKLAEIINEIGKKDKVQASVVVPSIIDTPANREAMPKANVKDWVTPEAIAEAIYFLISEKGNPLRDTVLKLYGNS